MTQYTFFEITADEVNLIGQALTELPLKAPQAALRMNLTIKLNNQVAAQNQLMQEQSRIVKAGSKVSPPKNEQDKDSEEIEPSLNGESSIQA